jgi:hypothetical protein
VFLLFGLPSFVDYCFVLNLALSRYFGKPVLAALPIFAAPKQNQSGILWKKTIL